MQKKMMRHSSTSIHSDSSRQLVCTSFETKQEHAVPSQYGKHAPAIVPPVCTARSFVTFHDTNPRLHDPVTLQDERLLLHVGLRDGMKNSTKLTLKTYDTRQSYRDKPTYENISDSSAVCCTKGRHANKYHLECERSDRAAIICECTPLSIPPLPLALFPEVDLHGCAHHPRKLKISLQVFCLLSSSNLPPRNITNTNVCETCGSCPR